MRQRHGAHFCSLWTLALTVHWRFQYTSIMEAYSGSRWALALTLHWRFRLWGSLNASGVGQRILAC
jgi:hypothetical protein